MGVARLGSVRPLEALERRVLFSAGDLDALFGNGGKVIRDIKAGDDFGFAIVVQADGKLVVAGRANVGGVNGNDFAVARFNVNGTPDTTFGTGGIVTTHLGSSSDSAYAMVLQSDGKLVVAGETTRSGFSSDFAMVRYNADGSLDTTFGSGGKVITDFATKSDQALSVTLTADGHIVAAGWTTIGGLPQFALAQYTSSGALDTTFGSGGKVTTSFAGGYSRGQSVTVLPNGSILVGGTAFDINSGMGDFAAVRYLGNGQIDGTFGAGGWARIDMGGDEQVGSMLVQGDGKIVLAGQYNNWDTGASDFALARLSAGGSADTTFGSPFGFVLTDFAADSDQGMSAAFYVGGRIAVAGVATVDGNSVFGLACYNTDGSPDTTFGVGGTVTVQFGASDLANAIAVDSQGRLVAAGFTMSNAGKFDFALARLVGRVNVAPTADPGSGYSVIAGSSVQLDGSGSFDPDGSLVRYEWDFNYNGVTFDVDASGVTSNFSAAGLVGPASRTIALRVTDNDGATHVATTTITVIAANVAPSANAGGAYSVNGGAAVQLDGSGSSDSDGQIVSYEWDFNYNGSSFDVDGTGVAPTFSAAGLDGPLVRTIALRVTDDDGATTLATTTIAIVHVNVGPTADAGGVYSVTEGQAIQLDGSASSDSDGQIVSCEWDFDYDGQNFDVDAAGTSPMFDAAGLAGPASRTLALRVTDSDGATAIATTILTIVHINVGPVANPGGAYTVIAGQAIQFDGSQSSDPDGQIVSYEWDFNYDGQNFDVDATGAKPIFNATGLTGPATRTIALRVTDDNGTTTIATTALTISAAPTRPPSRTPPRVDLTPDATAASSQKMVLTLTGTATCDHIVFRSVRDTVEVRMNGQSLGKFANISRIVAKGDAGNDVIDARQSPVPVELFGGKGRDRLMGSRFNDVLSGCDGDDDLFGGRGNDLMIGGMGKDGLHSRFGNDMLIGGALTVEQEVAQLQSMLSGFNVSPSCIVNDHARDHLFGTPGADKLLCGSEDKIVKLRR